MSYWDAVAEVVAAHEDEIAADLARARSIRDRAAGDLAEAERRVAAFEVLLGCVRRGNDRAEPAGRMTLHVAMRQVLQDSPTGMMRAADIATEIERRRLYRMRDGRPVEAQQIHARVGNYADDFIRRGTFIGLIDGPEA